MRFPMNAHPNSTSTLVLMILAWSVSAAIASAQVLSHQKISETTGGLDGNFEFGFDEEFGRSVVQILDLNGDGVRDLAVGGIGDDVVGGTDQGAIYILLINPDGTVSETSKITEGIGGFTGTLEFDDQFGTALAPIGDFNNDGVRDLAVGARLDDAGGTSSGAIYILFMNADGTVNTSTKINNPDPLPNTDDYFGHAIASLGDANGDGVPDLVVGAPRHNDGGVNRGAIFILYLNPDGTLQSHAKISDTEGNFTAALDNNDEFGSAIHQVGDLDGNLVRELAVGAPGDDDGGTDRGAVYLLFMNAGSDAVTFHVKISDTEGNFTAPLADSDFFGDALVGLGDFDGDGNYDLAVGATGDNDNLEGDPTSSEGAVYMLFLDEYAPTDQQRGIVRLRIVADGVKTLVAQGVLNRDPGNSLVVKLEAAIRSLDAGEVRPAFNQLQAFTSQVTALVGARVVSFEQGQELIDVVSRIIAELTG